LGERELCKLEVVGSIPIGSTKARSQTFVDGTTTIEYPYKDRCDPSGGILFSEKVKAGLAGLHTG
jgi:hypothetical protein